MIGILIQTLSRVTIFRPPMSYRHLFTTARNGLQDQLCYSEGTLLLVIFDSAHSFRNGQRHRVHAHLRVHKLAMLGLEQYIHYILHHIIHVHSSHYVLTKSSHINSFYRRTHRIRDHYTTIHTALHDYEHCHRRIYLVHSRQIDLLLP